MGAAIYLLLYVNLYRKWEQQFIADIGWFLQKMGAVIYLLV